ncbi:MAG: TolC family protein [Puia sp.]|nr:TolC family protein [Puia sp.]
MRIKIRLLAAMAICLSGFAGVAQNKWDLKRCVEYAVNNNISVRQSDVQARIYALTMRQNILSQYPTLAFNGGLGVNSGRSQDPSNYSLITTTYIANSFSLSSAVTIFNWYSKRNFIDGSRYDWLASLASTDKLRNDISLNVANAYLQVLLAIQQTSASELQLHLSRSQLENTQKQVMAGALPELNAAELESQLAQDSSSFITTRASIDLAVLNLKAYMGLDAATVFEVDTPPLEKIPIEDLANLQPEAIYSLALVNQPLQKVDQLQLQSARKYLAANRGALYPSVSLSGSLGTNYVSQGQEVNPASVYLRKDTIGQVTVGPTPYPVVSETYGYSLRKIPYFSQLNQNFGQAVGLSVNVPIFNGGSLRISYEKSKLNLRNTELQRDQDNLTLKQNIYQAYVNAVTAQQKFEANKKTLAATQKSFDFANKRYSVGMLNTIDLLTNQNNFYKAQIDLLYSQFDYVFKMKVLEFYKGLGLKM